MKTIISILFFLLAIAGNSKTQAQTRTTENICIDWTFKGSSIYGDSLNETLNLPHTWNSKDAQAGFEYYRGIGVYSKTMVFDQKYNGKRLFLKFDGVHTVADIYLNGVHLGQHRGGYSAFAYEITSQVKIGEENNLVVKVDNKKYDDILPLGGDFNMYGGIYRPVHLITTNQVCITPLDYASPGVYIKQEKVSARDAEISITTKLSNGNVTEQTFTVLASVFDKDGVLVTSEKTNVVLPATGNSEALHRLKIQNPELWNGRTNPYLYQVKVQLYFENTLIDVVTQPLGLRSFSVDSEKGFFLNGNHLALKGVSRHQDKKDKGSALTEEDHRTDMQLISEMGTNAIRLAHYQQSDFFYSLCDSAGMVVWAEIPFVGSLVGGYTNSPEFHENAKQQLLELIRQNYNHPSICFWGVFNELSNLENNSPTPLVKELVALSKSEDPTRLVTAASLLPDANELNFTTELIAWNKYFGWYYGEPEDLGKWADNIHKKYPELRLAVSEYGAGASINQHDDKMKRPFPMFHPWHPETYQALYHEKSWKVISERPFIWGSFVWNMFDFSADFRNEGDAAGMNDKGLVTYDRKTKKDAFYLYKVNWNPEPMVHITGKRHTIHDTNEVNVKVYSNLEMVELFVNEKSLGAMKTSDNIFVWEDVKLDKGNNSIKAIGNGEGITVQDQSVTMYKSNGPLNLLIWFLRNGIIPFCVLLVISIPVIFIAAFKRENSRWLKILYKISFFLIIFIAVALLVLFLFGLKYDLNIFDYSVL
jgi:beta-galactosidase